MAGYSLPYKCKTKLGANAEALCLLAVKYRLLNHDKLSMTVDQ
jgi:hypothetical protein